MLSKLTVWGSFVRLHSSFAKTVTITTQDILKDGKSGRWLCGCHPGKCRLRATMQKLVVEGTDSDDAAVILASPD